MSQKSVPLEIAVVTEKELFSGIPCTIKTQQTMSGLSVRSANNVEERTTFLKFLRFT